MTPVEATQAAATLRDQGRLTIPPCPYACPDDSIDIGPVYIAALAVASGRLQDCTSVDDLRQAVADGVAACDAGKFTADGMQVIIAGILRGLERQGRRARAEMN